MAWRSESATAILSETPPSDRLAGLLDEPVAAATFANPLYKGADPWVVQHDGWYYLCQADARGRIEIWRSRTLTQRGERAVVWTPPVKGWNRAQVWAPELHYLRGRWYIYYAACGGRNPSHRMGVLEATTNDPQGPFVDRGMLYTGDAAAGGDRNRWAIDGTVLDMRGQLYFIWSGWEDTRDVQHLYIAPMADPCAVSGNRVRVCANDCHEWEHVGHRRSERGLNEGPQVLVRNGRVMMVYSCSGSWQPTYKLGMLHMDEQADPLDPGSWRKVNAPVFDSTHDIFGVGHCCFTRSPDGTEDWILYHAKKYRWDCWDRVVRAQPFGWRADGFPEFGSPASTGVAMALPSGERAAAAAAADHAQTMAMAVPANASAAESATFALPEAA